MKPSISHDRKATEMKIAARSRPLPLFLKPLFWDHDFRALGWSEDRHLIIRRVLDAGDWQAVVWLRRRAGDKNLGEWLLANSGGDLDPRQLRFWQLILGLDARVVDGWVKKARMGIWRRRAAR